MKSKAMSQSQRMLKKKRLLQTDFAFLSPK